MNSVVIDTNILLIANRLHDSVSPECVEECIYRLQAVQQNGTVVIDDDYLILGEYLHKTQLNPPKGVGDVFLKWLLRSAGNPKHCAKVSITESAANEFDEFPDQALQPAFDAPDRKFAAVANAHPDKPPVWQGADCKWLDWWPQLQRAGIGVEFVCPNDTCRFYTNKFPGRPVPALPQD
ncbi:hypothetical protein [Saccharospirillum sp.]|uniref:hypothetical protein n=1 Tax=Saccharospirillum sp. TaxID=2033801 RepID=UPI0034A06B0C